MAGSAYRRAYRAVKAGDVAPVYYLTGDEDMLKDDLVSAILDTVVDPTTRDFNLDVRSAADLDGEALWALVETPPMLSERRAVVVRGIDQWRKNAKVRDVLRQYLERPSPTTVLVLTQAAGEKPDPGITASSEHVDAAALGPQDAARWLTRRAQRAGLALEDEAAAHLLAAVGSDLTTLALEIEKLAAAAPPGGRADAGLVADLVGVRRGETVHDWSDAALRRDVVRAVSLIGPVLAQSGISAVQMVMTLGTGLTGVRLARALREGGTPGTRLRDALFGALKRARPPRLRRWGDEAALWADAADRWTASELDHALRAAYAADAALKSSTVSDEQGILTTMLLQFAPAATRAVA